VEIVLSIIAVLAVVGVVLAVVASRRRRLRPRAPEPVERQRTDARTLAEPNRPVAARATNTGCTSPRLATTHAHSRVWRS